jgi:signal transduction histidine kinase/ligand-binding sensor domain-containing protein
VEQIAMRKTAMIILARIRNAGLYIQKISLSPNIWRCCWILLLALVLCTGWLAADTDRRVEQFAHTSWGEDDGAPGDIRSITQTTDGYLWLASGEGLIRFDGTTFEHYQPQGGPALPARDARALLALPNGDLWIGFDSGTVSVVRNSRTQNYTRRDGIPDGHVLCLARDRDGAIWVGTSAGLARFASNRWQGIGSDWKFSGKSALALFVDHNGTLWVSTENTLLFLTRGTRSFQETSIPVSTVPQISEAPNGKLWMAETARSVRPIPLGVDLPPSDDTEVRVGSQGFLFDREKTLWITTIGDGLVRIPDPEKLKGKPDRFNGALQCYTDQNGLTDNTAESVFQDREGIIWVGTYSGLDRFREAIAPVFSPIERHDADLVEGNERDIWIASHEGLAQVRNSRTHPVSYPGGMRVAGYHSPGGTIWWVSVNSLVRYQGERFTQLPLPKELSIPFLHPVNITEDRSGAIWMVADGEGLFRLKNGQWSRFKTPAEIGKLTPRAAFTDDLGRVWFGYDGGTVIYLSGAKVEAVSSPVGDVRVIRGRNREVWVVGVRGLAFFDGARLLTVSPLNAETFGNVTGLEETADGSLWLLVARHVIHIDPEELRRVREAPTYRVHYEVYGSDDGLQGDFRTIGQKEVLDTNGNIWFWSTKGLFWMSPASMRNSAPPPVSIRSVVVDGKRFASLSNLELPPKSTNLQIEFGALSLSRPKQVEIRYKLGDADRDWHDAGIHREVSYTNLGPGKYRFLVNARNQGGEWNDADTILEFQVTPAWYQGAWFRVACFGTLLLLLWLLYRLRLRHVEQQFNLALDVRVDERTRIARELHDTLIQSVDGLMLYLQAAIDEPDRERSQQMLEKALDRADEALSEGRERVHILRAEAMTTNDLSQALASFGEERARDLGVGFTVTLVGNPRPLDPAVRDEAFRIGREALANAFQHSGASKIELEFAYERSEIRLRIRDNGSGIDPKIIQRGKPGHWGISGMRERAQQIGSQLRIWSGPNAGTEVDLTMPAQVADRRRFKVFPHSQNKNKVSNGRGSM